MSSKKHSTRPSLHQHKGRRWRRLWDEWALWFRLSCLLVLALLTIGIASTLPVPLLAQQPPAQSQPTEERLPLAQVHSLPPTLAQWNDPQQAGDYFDQVESSPVGYLIWSRFPIAIYIEPPQLEGRDRSLEWVEAVTQAVEEWNVYLPLTWTNSPELADIRIWRRTPPLPGWNATRGRARSAETRYEVWVDRPAHEPAILRHRCTIQIRPSQTVLYLKAAARHELGHALGIWGHSSIDTDALYFSQVRTPPSISARDVNTLKRVYEQPTRLGWEILRG